MQIESIERHMPAELTVENIASVIKDRKLAIFKAVREHDGEAAAKAMQQHMQTVLDRLVVQEKQR